MSFKFPAFLIKKIFPPKKAVSTVDTIDLGDFNIDDFDISDYGEILLDDEPLDVSKQNINLQSIRDRVKISHKGEFYTIDEILGGKVGGKTIAMGDSLTIIIKLDDEDIGKLTEGKHTLKIEAESIPSLEISFELTNKSMNLKLDSNSA